MSISFFHLNIYFGKFIRQVIDYINAHDFDIINFQEVATGGLSFQRNNCMEDILRETGYQGVYVPTWNMLGDNKSTTGNATFFKKDFTLKDAEVIWLKDYMPIENPHARDFREDPRAALSLLLEKENKQLRVVNTHMAWGPKPNDEPYKIEQGKKLYEYLKTIKDPFVFSGDFNVVATSEIIRRFNTLARNLTIEKGITNTLNKKFHKAPDLFPPGLAVDYVYISHGITVNDFQLIDTPDLSDHFGLVLDCTI